MKDMDAMSLAVVRQWMREGRKPPRDVVIAYVADEEAGGAKGARWLVDNKPELFEGCTESISEVGGFSLQIRDDLRLYPVQTAQRGMAWMKLVAKGRAGHGSLVNHANAVTELADAVARIGRYEWPVRLTKTVEVFLSEIGEAIGVEIDPHDLRPVAAKLGTMTALIDATLRNTANPTMLEAGYKVNVIPQEAQRPHRRPVLARLRRGILRHHRRTARPQRHAARRCTATSRSKPNGTARWSTP